MPLLKGRRPLQTLHPASAVCFCVPQELHPGCQDEQTLATLLRTPPGVQHAAAPAAELVPVGQTIQTLGEVAKPLMVSEYFPALHGVQEDELETLHEPAGHKNSHECTAGKQLLGQRAGTTTNPSYPITLLNDPAGHARQEANEAPPVEGK